MEKTERSPAVAISNAIVQIHKEGYGKGATRARTRIMDDVIVVELEDVLTRGEQTLVAAGCEDQIRETRAIFHRARYEAFTNAVEEIMRRRVRAFMSQIHFDPDIAVEIFLLEPEEDSV
jgi:uncharacterized protein YbcI